MSEEQKAINILKNMTTNYSLSGEQLHYANILYYLIINLQQENQQLHNKIDKAIEYIEDYGHGYDCTGDGYYCLDEDNQKDLLEILKDSDVNE